MLFIPGYSVFASCLGYISKDYIYAMLLLYPSTQIIHILSYFLTVWLFRDFFKKKLSQKWYFKLYYEESKLNPWKTSIMMRILFIPITYKNYLISLMDINFWAYFVPALVQSYFYSSVYVVGGMAVKTLQDLIDRKIPYKDKTVFFWYLTGILSMLIGSIFVLVYFAVLTCRQYRKFQEKEKELKLKEKE